MTDTANAATTRRFAIIGHPVGHSLSPLFHSTAFRLAGLQATYEQLDIPPEQLRERLTGEILPAFDGLNVTAPHKAAVIPWTTWTSDEARAIGAVNTIAIRGKEVRGYNTDAAGIRDSLAPYATRLRGGGAMVFGAGGAARAVLHALSAQFGLSRLVIVNRTPAHADGVRSAVRAAPGLSVETMSLGDPGLTEEMRACDLVVQATSVGLGDDRSVVGDPSGFRHGQVAFDLIYRPRQTRFLKDAKGRGATVVGGLEMFIGQAAAAFEVWTGRPPSLDKLRPLIEQALG